MASGPVAPLITPLRTLAAIVVTYVLLAGLYSVLTPPWEAPDEPSHYLYVEHLATFGKLPPMAPPQRGRFYEHGYLLSHYESYQPPLYYALIAAPVAAVNAVYPSAAPQRFPPVNPDFPNATRVFSPALPQEPGPRTARTLSVVLGALTLLVTYRLALEVAPGNQTAALVATAFMAFIPQFTFLTGYVTNDNLADLLAPLCLLAYAQALARRDALSLRRVLSTGLLVALALLTKLTLLFLLPLGWLILAWRAWRLRSIGQGLRDLALFTAAALCLQLAGLALMPGMRAQLAAQMKAMTPNPAYLSLEYVSNLWPLTNTSFWGRFGWMNVVTPQWTTTVLDVLAVAGLAGSLDLLRAGRSSRRALLLLWAACVLVLIGFIRFNLTVHQPQGRLLFPALGAFAVLVALGWEHAAGRWGALVGAGVVLIVFVVNLICLFGTLLPAYGGISF